MNIEGTYTLQAPEEEVWQCLMNQEAMRATIPGIESLEQIDQNTYDVSVTIHYASLKGSYHGRVTLSEQQYPYHYRLHIEGEGSQGTFNGTGSVHLNARANTTIVTYKGTLTIGKPGPALTQSIVKGAVKLLIQQYFLALAEQLQNTQNTQSVLGVTGVQSMSGIEAGLSSARGERTATDATISGEEIQQRSGRASIYTALSSRIVHVLHLGAENQQQAARWEKRLRRIGIASSLLFLVWVGTRIPRRHK
ncbi:MAG: hypothetical protein NVS4B9_19460 [Ktedonobacteraceae bacterium]